MLKLHWGRPKHSTEIRAWTGATGRNNRLWKHCFTTHEVARWYGLSWGRAWFVGFNRFGQSHDYMAEEAPRVGPGADLAPTPSRQGAETGDLR